MKKTSKIVIVLTILFTTMACNLSQYLSDTPPVEWVPPTPDPLANQEFVLPANTCIPSGALSSSYEPLEDTEGLSAEPYLILNQILGSVFQEAALTQSAVFVNNDDQSMMSCAVFGPLVTHERLLFDIMVKQPDNLLQFLNFPEIQLTPSSLKEQFSDIGDSYELYHFELAEETNRMAELLITRLGETVAVFTYIYPDPNDDLQDFVALIFSLQAGN